MIKNIFNDKKARIQKLILIILIGVLIFLIPITLHASENATNTSLQNPGEKILTNSEGNSSFEQPLGKVANTVDANNSAEEITNITQTETNNSNVSKGSEPIANLDINILYPKQITRGENLTLTAIITNTGEKEIKSAYVNWILPSGFKVISKQQDQFDKLLPGNSFESKLKLQTSNSTNSGINEIKIKINY